MSKCYLKQNLPFYNRLKWIKKLNKKPIIKKLFENLTEKQAFKIEIRLIKELGRKDLNAGPLLNLTNGGEGHSGFKDTEKSKRNRRLSQLGKKLSKEHREKLKIAHLGKKHTKEQTEKIRLALIGKKKSKEHINKISNALKMYVYTFHNPDGGIIEFDNLNEFARQHKMSIGTLGKIVRGLGKSYYGYKYISRRSIANFIS